MKKIEAVLLDLHGTLVDTFEYNRRAAKYTFAKHNRSLPTLDELDALIRINDVEYLYNNISAKLTSEMAQTHRRYLRTHTKTEPLFPDVKPSLKWLRNQDIKVGLVTTTTRAGAATTLKRHGIAKYFNTVISGGDVRVSEYKPDPKALFLALKRIKISPTNAVMYGDTEADVYAGKHAGVLTIATSQGYGQVSLLEIAGADHVVPSMTQFVNILKLLMRR